MSPTTQADDVVHRALKAVPMGALIGSLLLLFFGSARSVAQRTVDPIENALAATVYIEVDRLFRGTEFSSLGSGFFLTSGGYIMTNNHVVTDTQIERISGALVRFQFTIMGIRVVVNPRTPQQVVLPARVIALDRGRDLALLKVKYEPTHYLDLVEEKIPRLTEEVFVVGFPLGNLLTLNEHGWISPKGGYPEVSIGAGRVTSVRKDDDGSVVAIQTGD
jgi:S1-C subfamily serine protease